jgi:hypothetical protein
VNVVWDPVGPPRADLATRTVYCAKPFAAEARATALHEACHVAYADEMEGLPTWRRELAVSLRALRHWHRRAWPDFDRAARHLAIALKTYTDAEQVPRFIVERDVPRALDAESYR